MKLLSIFPLMTRIFASLQNFCEDVGMFKRRIFYLLLLFLCICSTFLSALNRDEYELVMQERSGELTIIYFNQDACLNCLEYKLTNQSIAEFPKKNDLLTTLKQYEHLIPPNRLNYNNSSNSCSIGYPNICLFDKGKKIYKGYFDIYRNRYFDQFERYMEFLSHNPECKYFWPEISDMAAEINDIAYDSFYFLIEKTQLESICSAHFELVHPIFYEKGYEQFFSAYPFNRGYNGEGWGRVIIQRMLLLYLSITVSFFLIIVEFVKIFMPIAYEISLDQNAKSF